MTIEELRQKPIGVLEKRSFTIATRANKSKEQYFLVKGKDCKYYIGFSDDGSYCCRNIDENHMLEMFNNKEMSCREAIDIYMHSFILPTG